MSIPKQPEGMISGIANGTAYSVVGSGSTVIMVHGLGMHRGMWIWQLSELAKYHKVVTYDLLGHGESDNPSDRCSLSDFSNQLADLSETLQLENFALAGFSLGGMIVRLFTLRHSERVNALAILHSAHERTQEERDSIMMRVNQASRSGPSATIEAALERWFSKEYRNTHPDVMKMVRDAILANDPQVYHNIYRVLALGDKELSNTISNIDCPTLVMTGDEDYGNSADMALRMAETIPNATSVILTHLRHMALIEDPDAFNAPLLSFLKRSL